MRRRDDRLNPVSSVRASDRHDTRGRDGTTGIAAAGIDYLRTRWRGLTALGWIWAVAGVFVFADALDGALYFPIDFFAWLFLIEGLATLAVAGSGVG